MPERKKKQAGEGAIASCAVRFLHPIDALRAKYPENWRKKKLSGLKVQRSEYMIIRKYSPPTWTIFCHHDDFPNIELYAAAGNVLITEEGPSERFFEFPTQKGGDINPFSSSSIKSKGGCQQKTTHRPIERDEQVVADRLRETEIPNLPPAMSFLPSGRTVYFSEEDCKLLTREGVTVDNNDSPAPENVPPLPQTSSMVIPEINTLPSPAPPPPLEADEKESDVQWGFGGVCRRRSQGLGKPRASLQNVEASAIHQMSNLDLFLTFFFTDYIKNVVIPQTNLHLKLGPMEFSEFLVFIGILLMMSCYEGIDRESWWSLSKPDMFDGAPFRFNYFMSLERFYDILSSLRYTDAEEPSYFDPFFHVRQMEAEWNKNMADKFLPSWISMLDTTVMEWHDQSTCPAWMVFGQKEQPFGNKRYCMSCGESKMIWRVELDEGKDRPVEREAPEFNEEGETVGLIQRMSKPLWYTGKVVQMGSNFCVAKGILSLLEKGVFGAALIEKCQHWPIGVPGDVVATHFHDKNVADIDVLQRETCGNKWHVFCMKEPDHVRQIMSTFGTLEEMDGADTKRHYTDANGQTKITEFRYREPFANYFKYKNVVNEHTKMRYSPISIEKTWKTNYWPDRNLAWFLAITEVNTNLARSYFGGGKELPQLEFRKALAQEMIYNNFSVKKEDGSTIDGRRVRQKNVEHELVMAPPYTGRWIASKNEWHMVKSKYLQQRCAKYTIGCKKRTRTYCKCTMGQFFCAEHYAEHIVESDLSSTRCS